MPKGIVVKTGQEVAGISPDKANEAMMKIGQQKAESFGLRDSFLLSCFYIFVRQCNTSNRNQQIYAGSLVTKISDALHDLTPANHFVTP